MKEIVACLGLILGAVLLTGAPSAAKSKQGVSGTYACECFSGNTVVSGTCSTKSTGSGSVECGKHTGDTCTATCKMLTFQKGLGGGGAIAISPKGGKGLSNDRPKMQKSQ